MGFFARKLLEDAFPSFEIQIGRSQPFKKTGAHKTTTLDAEEAIVTALLAVGMILLAAVTIMLFF